MKNSKLQPMPTTPQSLAKTKAIIHSINQKAYWTEAYDLYALTSTCVKNMLKKCNLATAVAKLEMQTPQFLMEAK
jgi:hypothetical protein